MDKNLLTAFLAMFESSLEELLGLTIILLIPNNFRKVGLCYMSSPSVKPKMIQKIMSHHVSALWNKCYASYSPYVWHRTYWETTTPGLPDVYNRMTCRRYACGKLTWSRQYAVAFNLINTEATQNHRIS